MTLATFAAAQLLRVIPRNTISRAVGALCETRPPSALMQSVVRAYSAAYDVALDEADPAFAPYTSFDAFFTRKLREGMRPLDGGEETFVSPADGVLSAAGTVQAGGTMRVKGQDYTLGELLDDPAWARELEGGAYGVVYLSPRDYHRVHSPVSGKIVRVRGIEGDRFPVNRIGEQHVRRLFVKNRRVAIEIASETWGRVAVVLVGAMIVGRMTVVGVDQPDVQGEHRFSPARALARGDELGAFHLGSTVVFAVPKAPFAGFSRPTGKVLYGQAVASARMKTAAALQGNGA
jgi:phosphatidylserine decarboxylase